MHHEKTDTNTKYFILLRSSDDSACLGALHGGHDGRASAGVFFLGIGQFGARFGVGYAMHASWIFYLLALITAVMTLRRHKEEKRADMDQEAGGNGKGRPVPCKQ